MNNKNIKLKIHLISGDVVSLNGYSADTFRTLINASTTNWIECDSAIVNSIERKHCFINIYQIATFYERDNEQQR